MNTIKQKHYYLIILFFTLMTSYGQSKKKINWDAFFLRNDMVFDTLTTQWEQGVFTGNGLLGTMLYMKDKNTLRLEVGRTDVTENRGESISPLYGKARLPIGHFEIKPQGKIIKNTARLDIWNAEIKGTIVTDKGSIEWKSMTLSQTDVIIFKTTTFGNEKDFSWTWHPEISISSRTMFAKDYPKDYQKNPQPTTKKTNNLEYCTQPISLGGDYTTAWETVKKSNNRTYYISIGYNQNKTSLPEAALNINNAKKTNFKTLLATHRKWWHHYYSQSFVSIPDAKLESFYWIQQYKMASATRDKKPPIDLMGPWFRYTPWPAYWFNLNIQLTYSPLYASNRLELANGLVDMIDRNQENLVKNVPEQYRYNAAALGRAGGADLYSPVKVFPELDKTASSPTLELGNLTWCLYYYWLHYRYSMDENLKEKIFPILKRSINYYLNVMKKEDDQKWHLPYTSSPEYPNGITRDANYDLSLLRWGCQTLLKINPNDSLAPKWKDVLLNLTDYPTDNTGLRIGRDVAFEQSHRHYSHLLMIYPLCLMNWDQVENRPLIEQSLQHWHSFKNGLQGYSFTGGASIYAMMGNGDKALDYLNQLLDNYIKPNTMYLESGPVIETPLAAVSTIHDLLLQSWGDKIRIFPAVPNSWKEASFENLRTEGAFLISAVRKNGETQWVRIKSLAGEPCIIKPNIKGSIKIKGTNSKLISLGNDLYSLVLKKNEEVLLYKDDTTALSNPITPTIIEKQKNYWGTKKEKNILKHSQKTN
jgi:alpha-L-fucosidase 2